MGSGLQNPSFTLLQTGTAAEPAGPALLLEWAALSESRWCSWAYCLADKIKSYANFNKACRQNYQHSYRLFCILARSFNSVPSKLLHFACLKTLCTGSTVPWPSPSLKAPTQALDPGSREWALWRGKLYKCAPLQSLPHSSCQKTTYLHIPTLSACWRLSFFTKAKEAETNASESQRAEKGQTAPLLQRVTEVILPL